ncbi:hypothetical protein LZ32DRAFT_303999 [Colletotrichum eremochloae]|nr:hypothetical protein LZ32DRAFT_303999 [Colletotrichum eremochloae]
MILAASCTLQCLRRAACVRAHTVCCTASVMTRGGNLGCGGHHGLVAICLLSHPRAPLHAASSCAWSTPEIITSEPSIQDRKLVIGLGR